MPDARSTRLSPPSKLVYEVRLARQAERSLRRVRRGDPSAYSRIATAIRALATDPRPKGSTRLKGVDPPAWRFRVGGYRIVYEIREAELLVLVLNAAPRGEVYR
jgi:mRNA interferase RelE/StbE